MVHVHTWDSILAEMFSKSKTSSLSSSLCGRWNIITSLISKQVISVHADLLETAQRSTCLLALRWNNDVPGDAVSLFRGAVMWPTDIHFKWHINAHMPSSVPFMRVISIARLFTVASEVKKSRTFTPNRLRLPTVYMNILCGFEVYTSLVFSLIAFTRTLSVVLKCGSSVGPLNFGHHMPLSVLIRDTAVSRYSLLEWDWMRRHHKLWILIAEYRGC